MTWVTPEACLAAQMEVSMPWKETSVVEKRLELVFRVVHGGENVSAVADEYGISRKTAHKWLRRFRRTGSVNSLFDQSRRPRSSPARTPKRVEDRVVELRNLYGWSGRKIRKLLLKEGIETSRSTIDRIIDRNGLIQGCDRHRPATKRFERKNPNDLWQMDIKGEYILRGVERCYPLSLLDDCSRFSIGLTAMHSPNRVEVRNAIIACFTEYGIPDAILMDHGSPWWKANNPHGLTQLVVELIKQGINILHGAFAHPQTQGKVERFHQTLKRSLKHRGVPQDFPGMVRALREFRQEYNEIRPHQALEDETPASRYTVSSKEYNPRPAEWVYPEGANVKRVNPQGSLDYRSQRVFISRALAGERVWCRELGANLIVCFRHMCVREIDLSTGRTTAVVRPVETQKV